jgi:hypothetical protein
MTCPAHLDGDPTGLACARLDPHIRGHVYHASAGPDLGNDQQED